MLPDSRLQVDVALDVVRVNYECQDRDCGTAYTERQYDRELTPVCGHCGGALDKLTLVVGRRESA